MTQREQAQTSARLLIRCLEEQGVPFILGIPGVALPWAIEAVLARTGESDVSISGDGSFLMTGVELETAVRLNLPTVHRVWRDGSYNLVGLLALREYGREVGTHF